MLYKLSFAQLLTLIEVRNDRERRAYEAAQEAADQEQDGSSSGYVKPPPMKDINDPENLPSVSELSRLFGGGGMVG